MTENPLTPMEEISKADWKITPESVKQLVRGLGSRIEQLEQQYKELKAENERLAEQVKQNSKNSSKPPSQDVNKGFKAKEKKPKGKPRGAQFGHIGHERKLYPVEQCQQVEEHYPATCIECGAWLQGVDHDPYRVQSVDIPPVVPVVNEHRFHALTCKQCGVTTRARDEEIINGSGYGERVVAHVGVLSGQYRQSHRMVQELLGELFGIELSVGSINQLRQESSSSHLVIETTGLADPAPVIQTFFMDEDVQVQTNLDSVVTVVDAKHIWQHWDADEAQEQIAFADVVLLNKTDLVTLEELDELERRIRGMNAIAKIYRTCNAELEMDALLGIGAFDLNRALEIDPEFLSETAHEHDETVGSVAIVESGELDGNKLNEWISYLLRTQGTDIFRMKGILTIAGEDRRFVFQGVHMLFDGRADRPWKSGETRKNELVFIGRNLDEAKLREDFRACLV